MAINFGDSSVQSKAGIVGDPIEEKLFRFTGKSTVSGTYSYAGSATKGTNVNIGTASYTATEVSNWPSSHTFFTSYSVPSGATRIRLILHVGTWGEEHNVADYYGIGLAVRHDTTWSMARYCFFANMSQELGQELAQWSSHANDLAYDTILQADVSATNFNACKIVLANHENITQTMVLHDNVNSTSNYPSPQETYLRVIAY